MRALAALVVLAGTVAQAEGPPAVLRRKATTSDGVALALYRYAPAAAATARPPLLLVPDLGLGRAAFDLQGHGLAPFLQERGRDVFVLELRGQGSSAAPAGWRLADLVTKDLPAALGAIRQVRREPVDLVVHGYSGALVLAAASVELRGQVGAVVALSPAVAPEVPNAATSALLRSGGRFSQLGGGPEGAKAFELLFARGGRFERPVVSELRSSGLSDLSPEAAAELLSWMEQGDLPLPDGSTVQGRLASYDRPTQLVLPLGDNFAHPEFASPLRTLSRAPMVVRVLSRRELMKEDYSHLSVLHGAGAPADVFAPALAFLDSPPAPADAGPPPLARDAGVGLESAPR